MLKPLLAFLALSALAPLQAEPAPDPACPQGDLAVPRGPDTVCIGRRGEGYAFSFIYPRAATESPALEARLLAEAATAQAWIETNAIRFRAERGAEGSEAPPLAYEAGWRIDARTPELVAASGTISHYTGGAHGGIEYRTVLIDRRRDREIRLDDIFELGPFEYSAFGHMPRGIGAVQAGFCRVLTAEVRERRNDPAGVIECPPIETQPVTFLCGERGRISAMRVLLQPYVVGSWAEGPYEVDVPIDARMMASIKPRYRAAFGLARETRARIPARPCR